MHFGSWSHAHSTWDLLVLFVGQTLSASRPPAKDGLGKYALLGRYKWIFLFLKSGLDIFWTRDSELDRIRSRIGLQVACSVAA